MSQRVNQWEREKTTSKNHNYRGYIQDRYTFVYITEQYWRIKLYKHLGLVKHISYGYNSSDKRVYRAELKRLQIRNDDYWDKYQDKFEYAMSLISNEMGCISTVYWANCGSEIALRKAFRNLLRTNYLDIMRPIIEFYVNNKFEYGFNDLHYGNFGFLGKKIIAFDVIEFRG